MLVVEVLGVMVISLCVVVELVFSVVVIWWLVMVILLCVLEVDVLGVSVFVVEFLWWCGGFVGMCWCVEWNCDL